MKKKLLKPLLLLFAVVLIYILYLLFASNTGNIKHQKYVLVHTGSSYEQLLQGLQDSGVVKNIKSFNRLATRLHLPDNVHAGRYLITEGMGNYAMVSMFKKGKQSVVKLVINKLRTKQDIIRKLASQLEPDSLAWQQYLSDTNVYSSFGIDTNQLQCLILPNTYEFYWNVTPKQILSKLASYQQQYWNEERTQLASNLKLTPTQVITIASIVEEETNKTDEKPNIASVYINRYRIGMPLGADPTVKYAVGDFKLKRILNIHTQTQSPYNTYKVVGLPPGPICTPSKSSLEAVLHASDTQYLFFCAKEDFSGYHNFANNYTEHLANARKYQQALNARGIK